MSTFETASGENTNATKNTSPRRKPITFAEWFVVLNGLAPLVLLMWDARRHYLGADPIRNALHTTGSLALGFLVLTLAITPLRRLTGWKSIVEYRRPLGLVAFFYGLAHIAVYVGYDQGWNWQAAWEEVYQRRYLQLGGLAILMLLPLALTSSAWWIQRLGFRRWKRLHRLIYPATILALAHYWLQSKSGLSWQIGFIAVVVCLMLFRVIDWRKNSATLATSDREVMPKRVTLTTADQVEVFDCKPDETILDAAERNGVVMASMCRAGECGTCQVRLISGNVKMECQQGLSEQQQNRGEILACQAVCTSAKVSIAPV